MTRGKPKALGVDGKAFADPGLELPETQPPGKAGGPRTEQGGGGRELRPGRMPLGAPSAAWRKGLKNPAGSLTIW